MKKFIFLFFTMFMLVTSIDAASVTINRYDSEGKDRLDATLVGSKVELYKDNLMVMSIKIDETGSVVIDNLEYGRYGVKQGKATGYKQNIMTEYFYLDEQNESTTVNLYSEVIEGNLIINKYYESGEESKLDESAVFEIYNNDNLIKTIKAKDGVINEKLEYGTYLIKQVGGIKYYDLAPEFTVKIEREQDYVFDLYTDMEEDLKSIFDGKEEQLNKQGELLDKTQTELENMKVNLFKEKELLEQKQNELIYLESELENKKEEIKRLNEELINNTILLESKQNELNIKESELQNLKIKLDSKNETIINLENELNRDRMEINDLKELLNNKTKELEDKQNKLSVLEKEISKKQELYNDTLVVNVPNTYKKSYNKFISLILIFIGSLFIIYGMKKVTNY